MAEKLRRFYFLILIMILFITGAYGNWLINAGNKADFGYVFAGEKRTEVVAASGEAKEPKTFTSKETETKKTKVYASGEPVGIYIKTRGVLVLGTQKVKTENNQNCSPAEHKMKSGDYILKMNSREITSKAQFLSMLQKNEDNEIILTILRNGEEQDVKIQPVYSEEEDCYQIGAWIRNDTQGIGTVTYIAQDGSFAALGHGINDCDLGVKLDIAGGSVYQTDIASIMKGKEKNPGEVIGSIEYTPEKYLGNIRKNTVCGIFGTIQNQREQFQKGQLVEVADKTEIKTGEAYLRTSIGGKTKDYAVEIEKIAINAKDEQKALRITVTDPELIALTGGIIQGLSGSPILQNGKLIGAVTHVFVDSPTKGYGICAESMLKIGEKNR